MIDIFSIEQAGDVFQIGETSSKEMSLAGWDGKQGQPCPIEGEKSINFWKHFRKYFLFS